MLDRIFVQSDPIGMKGGFNTYAYAAGNPLKNIDLHGLAIGDVIDAFEVGVVAGVGAQYAVYKLRSPCNSEGKRYYDHRARGRPVCRRSAEMRRVLHVPRQVATPRQHI